MSRLLKNCLPAIALAAAALAAAPADAQIAVKLSEVFFDPKNDESQREYFEIYTPTRTDTDTTYDYYFVQLEGENGGDSDPGDVDFVQEIVTDSSGYFVWRAANNNCGGSASREYAGDIENGACTFLVVAVEEDYVPTTSHNWDQGLDGDLDGSAFANVEAVLDSVGLVTELEDIDEQGALYGKSAAGGASGGANFTTGNPATGDWDILGGSLNMNAPGDWGAIDECEYVARKNNGSGLPGLLFAADMSDDDNSGAEDYSDPCGYGVGGDETDVAASGQAVLETSTRAHDFPQVLTDTYDAAND